MECSYCDASRTLAVSTVMFTFSYKIKEREREREGLKFNKRRPTIRFANAFCRNRQDLESANCYAYLISVAKIAW